MKSFIAKTRLFIEQPLCAGVSVRLSNSQQHYLLNVLRLGAGASVSVFNGCDGEWTGCLREPVKKKCQIDVGGLLRPQVNCRDLWLLFAPVKKARLDFMAQKASELGVSCIWPVRTDYCQISRVNDNRLAANAIEAAEQTERLDIAKTKVFNDFATVMNLIEDDRLVLWCDESSASNPVHNIALSLQGAPQHEKAAILIGPEGGFSPAERKRLVALKNCLRISLGSRILRADTAAIAALSCYQSICGDWVS